jgi:hypothetical protein
MPEVTDPLGMLKTALDAVCATDPARLANRQAITELYRQLARAEAVVTRASAAFDAARDWEGDGARSAAAWISTKTHVPKTLARRRVYLGRELRLMDVVEKAWLRGDIGDAQANQLARARSTKRAETFARDEELLVSQASRLSYGYFARALAYWCYRADPDGCETDAEEVYGARRFHLSDGMAGTKLADGVFDPIGGAIFGDELKRREQELFEADWAEARERVGPEACGADLGRSAAQRRADAVVEMARRSGAVPGGARMPALPSALASASSSVQIALTCDVNCTLDVGPTPPGGT